MASRRPLPEAIGDPAGGFPDDDAGLEPPKVARLAGAASSSDSSSSSGSSSSDSDSNSSSSSSDSESSENGPELQPETASDGHPEPLPSAPSAPSAFSPQIHSLGLELSDTESQFNLDPFLNNGQGPMDPCCVADVDGQESSPHHGAADVCIEADEDHHELSSLVSDNLSSQLSSRVTSPTARPHSVDEDDEDPTLNPPAPPDPPPLPPEGDSAQLPPLPPVASGSAVTEMGAGSEDEEEPEEYVSSEDDEMLHQLLDETTDGSHPKHEEAEIVPKEERLKSILVEKGVRNNFDVLPSGWIMVSHASGMPIFLHRESRVVTVTRPYHIGPGSARKHSIPLDSIPCLNYTRGLKEEERLKAQAQKDSDEGTVLACPMLPQAKIETQKEASQTNSLTPEEFREYCSSIFQFRMINIKKFKTWTERRKYVKQSSRKQLQKAIEASKEMSEGNQTTKEGDQEGKGGEKRHQNRPALPSGTAIISIPVVEMEKVENNADETALNQRIVKKSKKDWLLNPQGKSYVCILHEYIQQSLKTQPHYIYREAQSSTTPYQCIVDINGIEYGSGVGASKKTAKGEAAKHTLEILIPDIIHKIEKTKKEPKDHSDLEFFDEIRIDDPRVADLCNKASEPSPYGVLSTCLQRNYALGDTHIHMDLKPMRFQKNEFIMKVNNREVSVICRTKKDGKQLAAQKLLQLLHPNVTSWGALLRLYGSRSAAYLKAKRERETEITGLQARNSDRPMPSLAILEKLKDEMRSIAERKKEFAGNELGKFLPPIGSLDVPIACPNSEMSKISL